MKYRQEERERLRIRFRTSLQGVATVCGVVLCVAAVSAFILPAVTAVSPVFATVTGGSPATGGEARIFHALRFTVVESFLSSVVALALGIPAGFYVARRDFPLRRALLALSGVPLCVPPVIIALAFVLFYGRNGILNTVIMAVTGIREPPVTFLYSLTGVIFAHGLYNFPVVMRMVSRVWERVPPEEEESARLLGAGTLRVFRTITVPHLAGALLSSGLLVFLYCFFSFIIVLLFGGIGGTTLEVELYRASRSLLDNRLSGRIALVETVAAVGIVFLYMAAQRHLSSGIAGFNAPQKRAPLRGFSEVFIAVVFLAGIAVFFVGPLCTVVLHSLYAPVKGVYTGFARFSFNSWHSLLIRSGFLIALWRTVWIALVVSLFSTGAALCYGLARESVQKSFKNRVFQGFFFTLPFAPLAVSSVMLGVGWTLMVRRGSVWVLIFAQTAISWPFAWAQIQASLDRIPQQVKDSARLLSPHSLDLPFRVLIPLVLPGILSGAAFVCAISMGDASLPLVLSLGRFENLALMLYRLVGSYRFSEACACATILGLLSACVFFIQDKEVEDGPRE